MSFIDKASAVLSRGGGGTYSVRSSTLDKLSIMTPPTNPSVRSSVFGSHYSKQSTKIESTKSAKSRSLRPLKKDLVWQRYK